MKKPILFLLCFLVCFSAWGEEIHRHGDSIMDTDTNDKGYIVDKTENIGGHTHYTIECAICNNYEKIQELEQRIEKLEGDNEKVIECLMGCGWHLTHECPLRKQ